MLVTSSITPQTSDINGLLARKKDRSLLEVFEAIVDDTILIVMDESFKFLIINDIHDKVLVTFPKGKREDLIDIDPKQFAFIAFVRYFPLIIIGNEAIHDFCRMIAKIFKSDFPDIMNIFRNNIGLFFDFA